MDFPAQQWIAWIAATVAAAMTMVSFAYSNFETTKRADDRERSIVRQLDQIDKKLNILLEKKR